MPASLYPSSTTGRAPILSSRRWARMSSRSSSRWRVRTLRVMMYTVLHRLVREHLATFLDHAETTYAAPLPRYVLEAFRGAALLLPLAKTAAAPRTLEERAAAGSPA